MTMTYEQFSAKYRPIANSSNTGCAPIVDAIDGSSTSYGYETYGSDLEAVQRVANEEPGRVFTIMDDGEGNILLTSGYHHVNRISYVITEVAHDPNEPELTIMYSEADEDDYNDDEDDDHAFASSPKP